MINNKLLIAYASRSGVTAEIATTIGKDFSENGIPVDVLPMEEVRGSGSVPGCHSRQRHS